MAPLLNVSPLVSSFDVGPLTLTRRGPPTLNAYGERVQAASVAVILRPVAVHTASARARLNLPEAIRNRETIELYTHVRCHVGDGYTDTVAYRGRNYIVSFVDDYELQGGVYISLAVLENVVQP